MTFPPPEMWPLLTPEEIAVATAPPPTIPDIVAGLKPNVAVPLTPRGAVLSRVVLDSWVGECKDAIVDHVRTSYAAGHLVPLDGQSRLPANDISRSLAGGHEGGFTDLTITAMPQSPDTMAAYLGRERRPAHRRNVLPEQFGQYILSAWCTDSGGMSLGRRLVGAACYLRRPRPDAPGYEQRVALRTFPVGKASR